MAHARSGNTSRHDWLTDAADDQSRPDPQLAEVAFLIDLVDIDGYGFLGEGRHVEDDAGRLTFPGPFIRISACHHREVLH